MTFFEYIPFEIKYKQQLDVEERAKQLGLIRENEVATKLENEVATKLDIAELHNELHDAAGRAKHDITELRNELKTDIEMMIHKISNRLAGMN